MKCQSTVSAFFRPVSKRVGAVEVTREYSASNNGEQQAHDVDNESVAAEADRNTNPEIDETCNCASDLPYRLTAVFCQIKCQLMKVLFCKESGLKTFCGCSITRMVPITVHAVYGQ